MAVERENESKATWNGDMFFWQPFPDENMQNRTISIMNISDNLWIFILLYTMVVRTFAIQCDDSFFSFSVLMICFEYFIVRSNTCKQPKNLWYFRCGDYFSTCCYSLIGSIFFIWHKKSVEIQLKFVFVCVRVTCVRFVWNKTAKKSRRIWNENTSY